MKANPKFFSCMYYECWWSSHECNGKEVWLRSHDCDGKLVAREVMFRKVTPWMNERTLKSGRMQPLNGALRKVASNENLWLHFTVQNRGLTQRAVPRVSEGPSFLARALAHFQRSFWSGNPAGTWSCLLCGSRRRSKRSLGVVMISRAICVLRKYIFKLSAAAAAVFSVTAISLQQVVMDVLISR